MAVFVRSAVPRGPYRRRPCHERGSIWEQGSRRGGIAGSLEAVPEVREEVAPDLLASVERRILWIATSVVHHANRVRPNRSVQSPVDLAGSGARY